MIKTISKAYLKKRIKVSFEYNILQLLTKANSKLPVVVLFLLLSIGKSANSQSVEALSRMSVDTIALGQQFTFELNLKVPEGFQVKWPVWSDTLTSNLEIIGRSKTESLPIDSEGNFIMQQQLTLTTFDTGWVYIPGIEIQFAPKGDSSFYTAQSNPLMLRVNTPTIDTAASFKPIKGPIGIPITFAEILPWIIGILGFAALLFAVIWLYIRRRNKVPVLPAIVRPDTPPHVLALEQLEQLRHEKLWQNNRLKEYYTQLSDIIRMYIEGQFHVNAIEMTTTEILDGLHPININRDAMIKLSNTLELADLVKFAKAEPTSVENDISLNHLIDFVKESYMQSLPEIGNIKKEEEAI